MIYVVAGPIEQVDIPQGLSEQAVQPELALGLR